MKIEIVDEKENPLLERKEIHFTLIPDEGGERYEAVRKKVAAMLDLDERAFVIQYMRSQFGKKAYKGFLKVYANEKAMRAVEEKYVLRRNGLMGEEK
jgi:small subunit ribosomal protein S24e